MTTAFKKPTLTPLHWCVYRLLLDRTLNGQGTLSQLDIYEHCREQGFDVSWNTKEINHNCHCRWLVQIIDDLNSDLSLDKLIAHHAYRYWIASEEEANALVEFYDKKIIAASAKKWAIRKKMRRHLQGKTVTNHCEPMEGSKAEPFHNTYREEE